MINQERLWKGEFGNAYHERNPLRNQQAYWSDILWGRAGQIHSVLEFGAGKGDNLIALRSILFTPPIYLQPDNDNITGIEVNPLACQAMREAHLTVLEGTVLEVPIPNAADLVITRGFLMHVPKPYLMLTLDRIYAASMRYICLAEYYSPRRRVVHYHGQANALWTDDFARIMLETYPNLRLVKYGFKYHGDNGDDLTYFLMEKVK